ncbi:outer membrane protein assembly factor BamD, partial [candidate division KSB1 bacterium]
MRKLFYIIPFILFVLLSTQCAYYNTFHNAKKFYKEAEKERKKREKTQVVELSPEEEEQLRKAGRSVQDTKNRASQQEMQNYQQAIERSSRVLEYFPNSRWFDDALILIGKCFYYRRDYKKAMRKFDEILANYPDSDFIPETRLLKARTFIGLEEFDTAEEQLRALSSDPDIPKIVREEARYELGGLYFKKQNYELAAENFASSAKSANDKLIKAMAQYRYGDCLIRLERYEEAPAILRRAVKISPNEDFQSQAIFKLGQAYSLNSEYDRAIKTFRTALSKEFDEKRIPRIKLELATNLQLKGDLSEAIKWYENIIEEHKRTDASARSYFSLGEIEEYIVGDYQKAKENYDLVRSEFSNSLIAPIAQQRSDNIRTLKELEDDIARLEGRYVEADSLNGDGESDVRQERDDGPINLSMDGMWVNYTGRDRPPPLTLRELTDADLARQAVLQERLAEKMAAGDSTQIDSTLFMPTQLDSAALAQRAEEEAREKEFQLSAKYLALAEVLLFAFDKPDSAIKYYQVVVEKRTDSTHVARALYSLSYAFRKFKADTVLADTVLSELIHIFPETDHAEGARKIL